MNRLMMILTIALLVVGILVSACQQAPASSPPTKQEAQPKAETKAEPKVQPQLKTEAPPQAKTEAKPQVESKPEAPEATEIRIGTVPVANTVTYVLADKLGYFKEEGFTKVEITTLGGGAELLPALQAGKLQFTHSNVVSAILGRSSGFDFTVVASNTRVPAKPPESQILMVKTDSSIKTPKDMAGKRIAVNNINNIIWLYTREILRRNAVDPDKVTFREVPFAQMPDALLNDQVDVISITEPFVTRLLDGGKARELAPMYAEISPGLDMSGPIASEKWIKEHPIATKKFFKAFSRAVEYINADQSRARKEMAAYGKLDEALAMKMRLDIFSAKVNTAGIQQVADLMLKDGLLKEKVDASKIVWEGAKQ